jgi:hypothetical protein
MIERKVWQAEVLSHVFSKTAFSGNSSRTKESPAGAKFRNLWSRIMESVVGMENSVESVIITTLREVSTRQSGLFRRRCCWLNCTPDMVIVGLSFLHDYQDELKIV